MTFSVSSVFTIILFINCGALLYIHEQYIVKRIRFLHPPPQKKSTQMVGRKPQNHSNLYSKTIIKIELSQNPKWMFIFSL